MVLVNVPRQVGLVARQVAALAAEGIVSQRLLVPPVERGHGDAQQFGTALHVDVLVGDGLKREFRERYTVLILWISDIVTYFSTT